MKAAPTSYSSKYSASLKENSKARGFIPTPIESNPKLLYNQLPVSARQHFSTLIDSNTPHSLRQQLSSTAFASTKLASSQPIQPAGTNTSYKHGNRASPQLSHQHALTESKRSLPFSKPQVETLKSPAANKPGTDSSKIGAFSKKSDFFAAAQEFNRSQLKAKTKSQGTSKGESLILEIPNNPVETRNDRIFGSYEPTPTSSPSRKPFLRTEASDSDQKGPTLDIKEYLAYAKRVASPAAKLFSTQDHTNIDRFNSNRINHFLNQKFDNFIRSEKSPSNSNPALSTRTSNDLRTIGGKSNDRSINKAIARLSHETDYRKHNSSNDSLKFGTKSSVSTKSSSSFRNKGNFIQLEDSNRSKQISYANPSLCVSPSALYQRLALSKEIAALKEAQGSGTPSYQFKGSHQETNQSRRDHSEEILYKKGVSQKSKGSTSNRMSFDNEKMVGSKGNFLGLGKSNPKSQSIDAESTHHTFKSISAATYYDEKTLSSQSKLPTYGAVHTEEIPLHFETEAGYPLQYSQAASSNISRSQSSTQMQENFDFERKRAEAMKNRISFHLDSLKLSKEISDFSNRLSTQGVMTTKAHENQTSSSSTMDKNHPKSTKHSTSKTHFDFGASSSSHHQRGNSVDTASPSMQKQKAENPHRSSLPPSTYQTSTIQTEECPKGSPVITLENEAGYMQNEIKFEKADKEASHVNVDFINFEEVPIIEAERRMNSVNKAQIFCFEEEKDHSDHLSDTQPEVAKDQGKSLPEAEKCENEEESEQLRKVYARMKDLLELHRSKEAEWYQEKLQLQHRVAELEKLLGSQVRT